MNKVICNVIIKSSKEETEAKNIYLDKQGRIEKITKYTKITGSDHEVIEFNGQFIVPGFFDSHTHGGYNLDFNDLQKIDIKKITMYLENIVKEGVTSVLATTVTTSLDKLGDIIKNFNRVKEIDRFGIIKGIHLEGPFISMRKKGAHEEKSIINNDIHGNLLKLIDSGNVKLITVAPEIKDMNESIHKLSNRVFFSLGHTDCSAQIAKAAFDAGATRVTHLYNAMSGFGNRETGLVNQIFIEHTKPFCEIIPDLVHVGDEALKAALEIVGDNKVIFVSDSLPCKGLEDGNHNLGPLSLDKKGDVAYLSNSSTLAGSTCQFNNLVDKANKKYNIWENLVNYTSANCYKSLGMESNDIVEGNLLDATIIDRNISVQATFVLGKLAYNKNSSR
jgi:N-acetylglucosamine-6-phosphate deacetylase